MVWDDDWLPGPTLSEHLSTKLLTWNHLDGRVHLLPVLSALELPVQDEVAVISDHWTLRGRQTHGQMTAHAKPSEPLSNRATM